MPMLRPLRLVAAALAALTLASATASAQDTSERGRFVRFLEGMLSGPDRQVVLNGFQGTFSSHVTVDEVTVADAGGVWLRIDDLDVVWNRLALFRRTLDIDTLSAKRIDVLRRPKSSGNSSGSGSFSSPVDVRVGKFSVPAVALAQPVAGVAANLGTEGSASLDADAVAAQVTVSRIDAPGGSLAATLRLEPQANALTADIRYSEPAGGLVAGLAGIPGQPALAFTLAGAGSLADWRGQADLQANGADVLAGTVGVARNAAGIRVTGQLGGALQPIVPPRFAPFFASRSDLVFDLTRNPDGGVLVQSAALKSGGADLQASGLLTADFFPTRGSATLRIGQAGPTALPFAPGDASVTSLDLAATLGEGDAAPWRVTLSAAGLQATFGAAANLKLEASGNATRFAVPAERATTFQLEGSAGGVAAADSGLAAALGDSVSLKGSGRWTNNGQPVDVEILDLALAGGTLGFKGRASWDGLSGSYQVRAGDLSRFAALAKRDLAGAAALNANGAVSFGIKPTRLMINAVTTDLRLGVAQLDGLLAGNTRIVGGVDRSFNTLRFTDLKVDSAQLGARVDGTVTEPSLDLDFDARLLDLKRLSARASGAAEISGRITGSQAAPTVDVTATGSDVVLMGRPLAEPRAHFAGTVAGPETAGEASLSARLAGLPVQGGARLAAGAGGARLLQGFSLSVGDSKATGDVAIGADGLLTGAMRLDSPDIAAVAPLFLAEARGAIHAEVSLSADAGGQSARLNGTARDLVYESVSLASAEIGATAGNLFSQPQVDGTFAVRGLRAGGLTIVSAKGTAKRAGPSTAFSVDADLADGAASLVGSLDPVQGGFGVGLDSLRFRRPGVDLRLAAPTTVTIRNGTAEFANATILAGKGRALVNGWAGRELALQATITALPAALANSFSAGLGAEGTISGKLSVTGTAGDPAARFNASWQSGAVAATRKAGLGALAARAQGSYAQNVLTLDSSVRGGGGLDLTAKGTLGTRPGAALGLRIAGTVPLALGNSSLADRGAALRGALKVEVAVSGTPADPRFAGTVTSEGGGFVDPETGIVLTDLSLRASVSNQQVTVERLTGKSGDGSVSAKGTIGIGKGFPADLALTIRKARYVQATLVTARFDADLTVKGGLLAQPELAGALRIDEADITVPEKLPGSSVAVQVKHLHPAAPVAATLAKARLDNPRNGGDSGQPRGIRLAVTIEAPSRIFVRGRGLDAELGGRLALSGPVSGIVAQGAFQLRRGRLDILTQRITFDHGNLTFTGDLNPTLDFSGTTKSSDVTVTVTVAGHATDPQVTFSSDPQLPDDEVLARLLFNRSVSQLSPVQLARLAAAASQYAGGSGGGILSRLRESTGLDDLDVVTDESGNMALQAGRYVSDNVYLGVQGGTGADSTKVTVDLDVTQDVKARAALSPQGSSSVGLFYEHEY